MFEGCQTKKIGLPDNEGKDCARFSVASLRVYSDIHGWVKLKCLNQ